MPSSTTRIIRLILLLGVCSSSQAAAQVQASGAAATGRGHVFQGCRAVCCLTKVPLTFP